MNKKYLFWFIVFLILGLLAFFVGKNEYIAIYLVNWFGFCTTGGFGDGFVTMGLYNCYNIVDRYLVIASYLFGVISLVLLLLGFKKKNTTNTTI